MNSTQLNASLKAKLRKLTKFFRNKKIIVAFSGGIDSTLLAYLAKQYAEKTLLLTASSILFSEQELADAKAFSTQNKIEHEIIDIDPLNSNKFIENPSNRCYICKKLIFSKFLKLQKKKDYDIIIEGTNTSELDEHRPGFDAIQELGIKTPYVDFDINKEDIRRLCRYFELGSCDKPPNACFASRIEYNIPIKKGIIKKVRKAESFLKSYFNLSQVRVRYHQGDLARIEFLLDDLFEIFNQKNIELIRTKLNKLGFKFITIDLHGYISGSMNR